MQKQNEEMVEIRNMTAEHILQVAAIEAEVFSVPWSVQGFADTLEMDQASFYVAAAGGKVAGYCGIYLAADEGEITNVAVSPVYRRQGFAQLLVEKVLSESYAKGARQIFLEVRRSNVPAICLYQKNGFQKAGIRTNFYQFPTEDALVMVRKFADK